MSEYLDNEMISKIFEERRELVDPRNWNPLRIGLKCIYHTLQLLNCIFYVIIDDTQVKIMTIILLQKLALSYQTLEAVVLSDIEGQRQKKSKYYIT